MPTSLILSYSSRLIELIVPTTSQECQFSASLQLHSPEWAPCKYKQLQDTDRPAMTGPSPLGSQGWVAGANTLVYSPFKCQRINMHFSMPPDGNVRGLENGNAAPYHTRLSPVRGDCDASTCASALLGFLQACL